MPMPDVVRPIRISRQGGQLWPTMFRSAALSIRCNVFVYTPPGVGRAGRSLARLPVLYLLHGMWGSEIDWPFKGDAQAILDRQIASGRIPPVLVAMPHDGLADDGTFYANWHDSGGLPRRFEDYMTVDLPRFVEFELTGRMRVRNERILAGLSMGGFGALMLALRHPEMYLAAASLSGAVRPIGHPRHPDLGLRIFGPFDRCPDSFRSRHDPAVLAAAQTAADPRRRVDLYLDCGRSDALLAMNRKLHARLRRLGVDHEYAEYSGAHDWPSWRKRLPHALRFLARALSTRNA